MPWQADACQTMGEVLQSVLKDLNLIESGFDNFCFEFEVGEVRPQIDSKLTTTQTPAEFLRTHESVNTHYLACYTLAADFDPGIIGLIVEREEELGIWLIDAIENQIKTHKVFLKGLPYIAGIPRPRTYEIYVQAAQAAILRAKAHALLREFDDEA